MIGTIVKFSEDVVSSGGKKVKYLDCKKEQAKIIAMHGNTGIFEKENGQRFPANLSKIKTDEL